MGFMDKAKKLAEQAQQKLDEAQTQFNQGGSTQGQPQAGGVQYDAHGRPIAQPPAADVPPPVAQPQPPVAEPQAPPAPPAADPATPAAEEQPQAADPPPPPPAPPAGGEGSANSSPDPFKPLQQ